MCLFLCLALYRGCDRRHLDPAVKAFDCDQDGVAIEYFVGVTMDDLSRVETTFEPNVCIYKLIKPQEDEGGKATAELVRLSLCHYPDTLYVNPHESHFSYIQEVDMDIHSYRCRKCGDSLWKYASKLQRHECTCTGSVRKIYPSGMYHPFPTVFQRFDDENIRVPEYSRYYPYRAPFDFECWFNTSQLPY